MRCNNRYGFIRYRAHVHPLGITKMHLRDPVAVMLWSAIFPGMGHILLGKNVVGFFLLAWELTVNYFSNLNTAIFYSFTGQFTLAKGAVNPKWLILYCPMYLFSIWDSYRCAVGTNKAYIISADDRTTAGACAMSAVSINVLERKSAWQTALWSLLVPGAGQLMNHQIILGFLLTVFWIANVLLSGMAPALCDSLLGDTRQAARLLDVHWALNLPSLYFFCLYNAYADTVEINRLFEHRLASYLRQVYGLSNASILNTNHHERRRGMLVVSTFSPSLSVDAAITAIRQKGIPPENITAVTLDKAAPELAVFDCIHPTDSQNFFDYPIILAAVFSLFGLIYGFQLAWGPVFWALIGTGVGFAIGLTAKLLFAKKRRGGKTQVVVLVECQKEQSKAVENTLLEFSMRNVGALELSKQAQHE